MYSPSEQLMQLRRLMRSATRYPGSAAKRGDQARFDVVQRYHPHVVAAGLRARLKKIETSLQETDGVAAAATAAAAAATADEVAQQGEGIGRAAPIVVV
jgi:hypothetical protein